ncbi:MAG TPA: hypothetical protein VH083_00950 [Myxococcales bacterium]|jgi:hypothetical protein|nr:hypothetical protein [Myxococcales bacterium]
MNSERVYTVTDYYDGPRRGVADVDGQPHTYSRVFDGAADDWTEVFVLRPVDAETLELMLAEWARWLRWRAAFDRGEVGIDTHPVLPAERAEHELRSAEIRRRLETRKGPTMRRCGRFEATQDSYRVIWSPEAPDLTRRDLEFEP